MPGELAPRPYPWEFVDSLSRAAVRRAARVRPLLDGCVALGPFEAALAEWARLPVSHVVRRVTPASLPRAEGLVCLECRELGLVFLIEPEPALAVALLARILNRPLGLTRSGGSLDDALRGALSAVLVEAARRSTARFPLAAPHDVPALADGLRADVTVFLADQPYRLGIWVSVEDRPTRGDDAVSPDLRALARVPIELPVVAAVSVAPLEDVLRLEPGDVFFPGAGWLGSPPEPGEQETLDRVVLAPPRCDRGMLAERVDERRWRLVGPFALNGGHVEGAVAVRVEVGGALLLGQQWSLAGRSGTLSLDSAWSRDVLLRVTGEPVARGVLERVHGELGVRVITGPAPSSLVRPRPPV